MRFAFVLILGGCSAPPPPPRPVDAAPPPVLDPPVGAVARAWIELPAGTFRMGTEPPVNSDEGPAHEVTLPAFALMRHEALSTDYHLCVAAGACKPPGSDPLCSTGADPRLPQNCLDWDAASAYCAFAGARLPSEAEWEYAATSGGRPTEYPWGDQAPDCERANVVVQAGKVPWCPGANGLWPVCTHPFGNTPLGLCEMGGNAFEWVEDWYHFDYGAHPADGRAQAEKATKFRSMRGGGIGSEESTRSRDRTYHPPDFQYPGMGVRCARSR